MTLNYYIIDTSSLVKLNRDNPVDIFPSLWKNLSILVKNGRLIAPKEVLNEIKRQDDQLLIWAKKQKKMFKDPTKNQIEYVKEILKAYPAILDVENTYCADPWVIALSLEMIHKKQKTLISIKRIVVTEEKLRGNRVKIPLICKHHQIESIDIINMFRLEGWTF